MKTLMILACFAPLFAFGQGFNSIRTERFYNKVSLKRTQIHQPDTVKAARPDTVTLHADTVGLQDTANNDYRTPQKVPDFGVSNPLSFLRITSNYGMRFHPIIRKRAFHSGVDLSARQDTVKAILNGTVVKSGYDKYLGYFVKVAHGDYVSTYGHLSKYFVLKDEVVACGEGIGITGSTGRATGEHLHFAVHHKNNPINPLKFLQRLIIANQSYTSLTTKQNERIEPNSN